MPSTARLWLRLTPLHLLAVLAVAVCVAGGLWQLNSYQSRQSQEATQVRADVAPLDRVWALGEPISADLVGRVVTTSGTFAAASDQFWVQGEQTQGRAWLVAPVQVEGSDGALLVVRGSAEEPGPVPPVPSGREQFELSLQPSVGGAVALTPDRTTTAITIPVLLNELPYRLWSGYAIPAEADADAVAAGLDPVSPPDPDVSWTVGLVNLAYAFQWWVFALFAAFMWWRMCTDQVADARARAAADEPSPDEETTP